MSGTGVRGAGWCRTGGRRVGGALWFRVRLALGLSEEVLAVLGRVGVPVRRAPLQRGLHGTGQRWRSSSRRRTAVVRHGAMPDTVLGGGDTWCLRAVALQPSPARMSSAIAWRCL